MIGAFRLLKRWFAPFNKSQPHKNWKYIYSEHIMVEKKEFLRYLMERE